MEYYQEIRQYVGNLPLILPGALVIIQNEFNEILLQVVNKDYSVYQVG